MQFFAALFDVSTDPVIHFNASFKEKV